MKTCEAINSRNAKTVFDIYAGLAGPNIYKKGQWIRSRNLHKDKKKGVPCYH